jgi:hypothetical protein
MVLCHHHRDRSNNMVIGIDRFKPSKNFNSLKWAGDCEHPCAKHWWTAGHRSMASVLGNVRGSVPPKSFDQMGRLQTCFFQWWNHQTFVGLRPDHWTFDARMPSDPTLSSRRIPGRMWRPPREKPPANVYRLVAFVTYDIHFGMIVWWENILTNVFEISSNYGSIQTWWIYSIFVQFSWNIDDVLRRQKNAPNVKQPRLSSSPNRIIGIESTTSGTQFLIS